MISNMNYVEKSNNSLGLKIADPEWWWYLGHPMENTTTDYYPGFWHDWAPTSREAIKWLFEGWYCSGGYDYSGDPWMEYESAATFDCSGGDYSPWWV